MNFQGKLLRVGSEKKVGEKEWLVREFVVEESDGGEYPNSLKFQLFGEDKVGAIKPFNVGDGIDVEYNAKAKVSKTDENMYFNSIDAWRIKKLEGLKSDSDDEAMPF